MMNLTKECTAIQAADKRQALLGAAHGYRFNGDTVHLNAMFTVVDAAAHDSAWALQLWACPVAPRHAGDISGQRIAEVALPPIGELADDTEGFEVSSPAWTPASRAEHFMVLALVSGTPGHFSRVHDFFVYPATEQFLQPRMSGTVGYCVEGDRVRIDVDRIENPRDAANLSGSLALELWALARPYGGGKFNGISLAGVAFDPLHGQHEYSHRSFDLPFVPPPAGTWNVVLMLREWTAAGFMTRDYANFSLPFVTTAASTPAEEAVAPKPVGPKPAAATPCAGKNDAVSVNRASRQELAQVKGLPSKVAEEIVRKRPFKSVDELVSCKGMGAKLLARLRSKLRL